MVATNWVQLVREGCPDIRGDWEHKQETTKSPYDEKWENWLYQVRQEHFGKLK